MAKIFKSQVSISITTVPRRFTKEELARLKAWYTGLKFTPKFNQEEFNKKYPSYWDF